jgi:hypothetical protein
MLGQGGKLVVTLATAQRTPAGTWSRWPVHQRVVTLVDTLNRLGGGTASIEAGPNSRQYNNIALVVQT